MLKKSIYFLIRTVFLAVTSLAAAQDNYFAGTTQTGAQGVTESVSKIMAREAAHGSQTQARFLQSKPRHALDGKILPQNPASPPTPQWPGAEQTYPQTNQTSPFTPQVVGTNFLGVQLSDTPGFIPPDSMGDVGTNQIVVCVNGRIRSFSKNGGADGALDADTDVFFASVLGGSSTSDPRVRYDRLSGRWFITMITVNTPNFVLVAVSSGPTITSSSSFTFFSFPADPSNFGDYDTLGVDANALYIGVNVFTSTFQNTTAFVVNKSNLLNGTLTVTTFANLIVTTKGGGPPQTHGPYTPQGVNNDDPNATEGYFIGVDDGTFGTLAFRRISNPGSTPTISPNILITTPSTTAPITSVPALGTTTGLDALDWRLFATRMHKGSLLTAHNIQVDGSGVASSSGGRDGARWYQITNLTGTPVLAQSGTLFDPAASNPRNFWIPSCAMSGQGHMALGCSVAGNIEHAEIAVAGRFVFDAPGTIQSPTTAVTTSSTYNINDGTNPHRWGDYSVTTVDPSDDMTMWTVQEFCNANNSWAVQVLKLLAPPPALPTNCAPATVNQGTNVNVVILGSLTNGAGFFDPGAGFPNHLAASVNGGGVTVNSVTYNNPANITLNLSIATNATAGARTFTVTNPDGQSATSVSGILNISGNLPPAITGSLTNRTLECGGSISYAVTAAGTSPFSYQWSLDGTPISGATSASLSLTNVHLPNHTVTLVVTNLYGSVTSNALLTVHDTLAPVVALNGGNPISIELGSVFTDPGATANDLCAGSLSVVTSGIVNTNAVGTNVLTFTANDGNGNTNSATRAVIVRDTTPPTIFWSFTNLVQAADTNCVGLMTDVTGTNFIVASDLSGALTILQNPTNNSILPLGTNLVVITVEDASGNSAFSTNFIVVQDQAPPVFASGPQSLTNLAGTTANFSAAATACTPLAWQWFFNSAVLVDQTNNSLTFDSVGTTNAGNYFVVASASGGSSTSAVATLTVNLNPPDIASETFSNGSFTLNLTGTPGYTYVLEATTNLLSFADWQPLATNTLGTNGVWQFADPATADFPQHFYRLKFAQ